MSVMVSIFAMFKFHVHGIYEGKYDKTYSDVRETMVESSMTLKMENIYMS